MSRRLISEESVDALLRASAAREWPGPGRSPRFEEFLMNEVHRKGVRWSARRIGLMIALGALGLTGAVYGGVRIYDEYIVRVTVNGEVAEFAAEPDAEGLAMIEVPMQGGGRARVLVGPENIGPDGKIHVGLWSADAEELNREIMTIEPCEEDAFSVLIPEDAVIEEP